MKLAVFTSTLLLLTSALQAQAQDDGPRQLGGPPVLSSPPARTTPLPRTTPAATDTVAARPAAPPPAPANVPAPIYAPIPARQLPGDNTRPTRYQVGLKNGLVYQANEVELKSPLFGRNFLLLDGQRRVEFGEVGFYENEYGHFVRTTLPNSTRESTLRRDKTGRISLYSITTTQYNPNYGGGFGYGGFGYGGLPYGGYRTVKTEYFSKDNGPIQNLNLRNLSESTRDNAGAQQLLADARRYQHLIVTSYVAAGGLLVAGLVQSARSSQRGFSPLTFAALPVLIVPLVLQSKQARNQRDAITLYNRTQ